MRERLRRAGIRSIQAIVDITNYVMLELGQPMHAFDADKLAGNIRVRRAAVGESLQLLNEQTVVCEHHELLISDDKGAVALRSEEHTSELQSLMRISYAVFCLNKKKKTQ